MEKVLIGFGSNQGEPFKTCVRAIEQLRHQHGMFQVMRVSSFYRTKPVGPVEQQWFINGVIEGETSLSPEELFEMLRGIERDFGRIRPLRWGPRTLDLDILAYGDRVVHLPFLTIPHPRLHERLFVLEPLLEIAPSWIHPELKTSAREFLAHLLATDHGQEVERLDCEAL